MRDQGLTGRYQLAPFGRIHMAGKSKKQRGTNQASLGTDGKAKMVSLKVKKQKKKSRGK
jgi:hypothetical protein